MSRSPGARPHTLGDDLDGGQVVALAKRRELLIEHVKGLLARTGEPAVLC
jgi:hypothetical protein